jgi:hypothetical protein
MLLLCLMTTLSSGCGRVADSRVVAAPDPCVSFNRIQGTNAQVDDAKRSAESRKVWRPLFDQVNAHNDVWERTCGR